MRFFLLRIMPIIAAVILLAAFVVPLFSVSALPDDAVDLGDSWAFDFSSRAYFGYHEKSTTGATDNTRWTFIYESIPGYSFDDTLGVYNIFKSSAWNYGYIDGLIIPFNLYSSGSVPLNGIPSRDNIDVSFLMLCPDYDSSLFDFSFYYGDSNQAFSFSSIYSSGDKFSQLSNLITSRGYHSADVDITLDSGYYNISANVDATGFTYLSCFFVISFPYMNTFASNFPFISIRNGSFSLTYDHSAEESSEEESSEEESSEEESSGGGGGGGDTSGGFPADESLAGNISRQQEEYASKDQEMKEYLSQMDVGQIEFSTPTISMPEVVGGADLMNFLVGAPGVGLLLSTSCALWVIGLLLFGKRS